MVSARSSRQPSESSEALPDRFAFSTGGRGRKSAAKSKAKSAAKSTAKKSTAKTAAKPATAKQANASQSKIIRFIFDDSVIR